MILSGILDTVQLSFIADDVGGFNSTDVLIDEILLNLIKHESVLVVEGALYGISSRISYRKSHYNDFVLAGCSEEENRNIRHKLEDAVHNTISHTHKGISEIASSIFGELFGERSYVVPAL